MQQVTVSIYICEKIPLSKKKKCKTILLIHATSDSFNM
jgi:hypothetical protein